MTPNHHSESGKPPRIFPWRGLRRHLWLTLRLNFRSRQPLIYGYLVPVCFLLAFGSVFRSGTPPLRHELGQLLTITILGGACFGMPTATVAERERGVWRRYQLLPAAAAGILLSTVVARFVLILSAAALQIGLAWAVYRTPWPAYPASMLGAFACTAFAFLGLGLMIAMLADNVPAVQALGQAVFLPMIMIGGVGVPLRTLPPWAQHVAGFLPGRYAVEALDACIAPGGGGLGGAGFALGALVVIGAAAFVAATGLFRWEAGPRVLNWSARGWITLALTAWAGVGWVAERQYPSRAGAVATHSWLEAASPAAAGPWRALTAADFAKIHFDDLPPDDGNVVPLAAGYGGLDEAGKTRLHRIQDQLAHWKPGTAASADASQCVRNLLSVCAVADLVMDPNEAEIARAVLDQIKDAVRDPAERRQVLAWIVLHPTDGSVLTDVSDFGIEKGPLDQSVRERSAAYARKFLREMLLK